MILVNLFLVFLCVWWILFQTFYLEAKGKCTSTKKKDEGSKESNYLKEDTLSGLKEEILKSAKTPEYYPWRRKGNSHNWWQNTIWRE